MTARSSASGPSKSSSRTWVTLSESPGSNATSGVAPGLGRTPIRPRGFPPAPVPPVAVISWPRRQRAVAVRRRPLDSPDFVSIRLFERGSRPPTQAPPNDSHGHAMLPGLPRMWAGGRSGARSRTRSAFPATRLPGATTARADPCRSRGGGPQGAGPCRRPQPAADRPRRRGRAGGPRPASRRTAPAVPASASHSDQRVRRRRPRRGNTTTFDESSPTTSLEPRSAPERDAGEEVGYWGNHLVYDGSPEQDHHHEEHEPVLAHEVAHILGGPRIEEVEEHVRAVEW